MFPHGDLGLITGRFCWMLVHDGPDAIIYTDIGGLIRFWNESAERLFGYSAREVLGRSLDFVIPKQCAGHYWEKYAEAARANAPDWHCGMIPTSARRKDGRRIEIELTIYRYPDSAGALVGIAVIARDAGGRMAAP